ncbi:BUB3 [Candida oxycetoniae]|uniref:BUB3 n=1 Tax=Candida oxycetoniae TaxID=497107 RepID=A0AAI9SVB8_9ASCO|nr:BUB3 [Candida oxycetoniae]KAI3403350.2 BUB3 [Candida oxycetoniae]
MSTNSEFIELITPKNLGIISDAKFSRNQQDQLLVSTWCNRILLYNCKSFINYPHQEPTTHPIYTFDTAETPLCLLYPGNSNSPIVGSLDGSIRELDFENMKLGSNFGKELVDDSCHINGINNICQGSNHTVIASSFNKELQALDQRQQKPIAVYKNKQKILTMDSNDKYLILGLAGNKIEIYNLSDLSKPVETRDVGLRFQFQDIKAFPNQEGFAIATIDARVSVEFFSPSRDVQDSKRFIFKSHRHYDKTLEIETVYPINSLSYDKTREMLITGGSDGYVCLWDIAKRKRMKQFKQFQTRDSQCIESVAKLDVSFDDDLLVVATSDDSFVRRRSLSEDIYARHSSRVYLKQLRESENRNPTLSSY